MIKVFEIYDKKDIVGIEIQINGKSFHAHKFFENEEIRFGEFPKKYEIGEMIKLEYKEITSF